MKNLLAIDIGNTNITVGLFTGKKLAGKVKIPTASYSSYIRKMRSLVHGAGASEQDIEAVISSVVPLALARLIVELRRMSPAISITILGKDKKVPIKNRGFLI